MPVPDWYRNTVNFLMPGFSPPTTASMGAGRRAERSVPFGDPSALRAIQAEAERLAQLPQMQTAMGDNTGMGNYMSPQPTAPAPNNGAGSMANARQQEIQFANQPVYGPTMADMPKQAAGGFQLSPANGGGTLPNAPLPPSRPADLGGPMQAYTVDPGDGGVLKTFMAQQAPNLPGMTVMGQGAPSNDIGILAKLLRGSF